LTKTITVAAPRSFGYIYEALGEVQDATDPARCRARCLSIRTASKELRRSAFPALLGTLSAFVRITIVLGLIFNFLLVMLF
jgi:hypothetical protein